MFQSLREVNLFLEIIAAVGVIPLMRAVIAPGEERKKLRPYVIYMPVLMWVVTLLLMISTGALVFGKAPLTGRTWIPTVIMVAIIVIQVILVRRYSKLPRHSFKSASARARPLASRVPARSPEAEDSLMRTLDEISDLPVYDPERI